MMVNKKFEIKEILDIKITDKNGEEIKDIRDIESKEEKFDVTIPILELVKKSYPSFELCRYPLLRKYGHDTFGSICDDWYWKDNLSDATYEELWKMFALISADWLSKYQYWYNKKEYELRKLKK